MKKMIHILKEIYDNDIFEKFIRERNSPLSPDEEKYARHIKPALKAMIDKYGEEKGKQYFYATVRKNSK